LPAKNTLVNIILDQPDEDHIRKELCGSDKSGLVAVINDAVYRTNNIVFHTYNFIKLYILCLHKLDIDFPEIDKDFVYTVMGIVSIRKDARGRSPSKEKQKLINELVDFYNDFYHPLICVDDIVEDDRLPYILKNYECVDIVKNIDTNIKEHFFSHIRKYVNIKYRIKERKEKILKDASFTDEQKKINIKIINERFNNIKFDILSVNGELKSDKRDIRKVDKIKKLLLPSGNFKKDSIFYDIKVNPQRYLKSMIVINEEIQKLGEERKIEYKLFHPLPLRTSIVPKYITIDTAAIVSLFIGTSAYFKELSDLSDIIWGSVFNLEDASFKRKNHKFNYMIKTDGVACSVLLEKLTREEIKTERIAEVMKKSGIKRKVHNKEKNESTKHKYKYIEDVELLDRSKKKNFVFIDPGHNDLINCLGTKTKENGKEETFRYTRGQRNAETKKNRNRKIISKIKNGEIIKKETKMSNYNSRTCDLDEFGGYLKAKIKLNRELVDHYNKPIYRKLKFNIYTNTRKSESKMLKRFSEKFGKPKETIVIFGDYDKKETMKGSEPHIAKRMKKVIVDRGYKLYLINEHNTSKLCNKCSCVTANVEKKIKGKVVKIWKLLRCKSEKCLTYHNRDENACRNMKKIVESLIKGKGRPSEYISRYGLIPTSNFKSLCE